MSEEVRPPEDEKPKPPKKKGRFRPSRKDLHELGDPVARLNEDLLQASKFLTRLEARFLVDTYYQMQEYRKAASNQIQALEKSHEPTKVLRWVFFQQETLELQIKHALDLWSDEGITGPWAKSLCGIGPVISAGLGANIDIEKCETVGHIWRFAGLDPTVTWEKGEKRPWNASLKTLCWKIGESFVKFSNHQDDIYGKVYRDRKAQEEKDNEKFKFADQAKAKLEKYKIRKETDAYKAYIIGKLPPAHIHSRAKRYATKLFLAHWHHVAYREKFKKEPPKPYVIEHLGHVHFIAPPKYPFPD